jgi:hypothetical protein
MQGSIVTAKQPAAFPTKLSSFFHITAGKSHKTVRMLDSVFDMTAFFKNR